MCLFSIYAKCMWQKFEPSEKYLSAVKDITTVNKLDEFLDKIKYVSEEKDYWETPEEVIENGECDCDGYARLAMDILERIQHRENVRFILYDGYYMKDGKKKRSGHAVAVFDYMGKLAVISDHILIANKDNYEDIGHLFYPKGLKFIIALDSNGKITYSKNKWFGIF